MEKIVREYDFNGISIGQVIENDEGKREFVTELSELEIIGIVQDMDPKVRLHMKQKAYGVHRALRHYGITPTDYVDNNDVMMRVTELRCRTMTTIAKKDNRAYRIIMSRPDLDKEVRKFFVGDTPDKGDLNCDLPYEE